MASSFFSEFGLMWYLKELKKDEFRKFKELLKQEPLHLGLQQIPWADVKKATREDLANLLVKHYEKQQAWDVTFIIFQKIDRKDLCEKAKREIAGHGKMYRAHIKEKFSEMWFRDSVTRIYDCFEKELIKKEHEYLEFLFAPKETRRQTVILRGIQGIGKTTLLVRLMLAWAEGTLYQQFSYIFYFCCRELKRLTAASLAELVCRDWSNSLTPIGEITSEPERLLFIIDGFEELKYGLNEPESDLCSNWMEHRPIQVILSSLLRKKMLPESSLLIAAVPTYPQVIEDRLECPEIKTLSGFTEGERKVYFSHIFQDKSRSIKAFRFIRENVQLFSMCQIPILCWVVCTCLKQEMERKKDLALTCRRTTSLYSSFVLNLFTPMGSSCLDEQSQVLLKGLCSLAAEGMWNDTFVFNEEDLRRNGLVDSDIPALLGVKLLHKCRYTENSYMFIHVCIQEFCAALFYLVKSHTNHPNPAVGSTKALLSTYLKNKKVHWIFLGCFMFGLLNEKEQQKLDAFFGYHLCQEEIQQTFQQHLWSVFTNSPDLEHLDLSGMRLSHSDVVLLCNALNNPTCNIEKLLLVCCYPRECCWGNLCDALLCNKNLIHLDLSTNVLKSKDLKLLCEALKQPFCCLKSLCLLNCFITSDGCRDLASILTGNPNLRNLQIGRNDVEDDGVRLLCRALLHPNCHLEHLGLGACKLTSACCEDLASVLTSNRTLKTLNLMGNALDRNGVLVLCAALRHPECRLRTLGSEKLKSLMEHSDR
ncbi:NACHT, LRR and PYD domains-containing protein 4 [Molossus nigricans]